MTKKKLAPDASIIKQAVDEGRAVVDNYGHPVIRALNGQYYIKSGTHSIGLTWTDGVTLNAQEFYEVLP